MNVNGYSHRVMSNATMQGECGGPADGSDWAEDEFGAVAPDVALGRISAIARPRT